MGRKFGSKEEAMIYFHGLCINGKMKKETMFRILSSLNIKKHERRFGEILGLCSYHSGGSLEEWFKGKNIQTPHFGLEIEVENKNANVRDINIVKLQQNIQELLGNYSCKIETDGSLSNGVEIITAPFTQRELCARYTKFYKMFQMMVKQGWRAHDGDNCGLHVHVTKPPKQVVEVMEALLYSTSKSTGFWREFSRRSLSQENQYCAFRKYDGSKYVALNRLPEKTVEMRFFKGTLNTQTFLACLEASFAIVNFSYQCPIAEYDWNKFVEFCRSSLNYKHFCDYVERRMKGDWREIITNPKTRKQKLLYKKQQAEIVEENLKASRERADNLQRAMLKIINDSGLSWSPSSIGNTFVKNIPVVVLSGSLYEFKDEMSYVHPQVVSDEDEEVYIAIFRPEGARRDRAEWRLLKNMQQDIERTEQVAYQFAGRLVAQPFPLTEEIRLSPPRTGQVPF